MRDPLELTRNRTGILTAPDMGKEMIENAEELSPPGGAEDLPLHELRADDVRGVEPAGTMPPIRLDSANLGAPSKSTAVLLDALGARLAFERTGTRIYEALCTKVRASGAQDGGPTEQDLLEIWNDELAHFQLLHETIVRLGGDPTAVTPSANVEATASLGVIQVAADPRLTLLESLHASLLAELGDRDGWEILIGLVDAAGEADLVEPFCACLAAEERHLASVRSWISVMKERQIQDGFAARQPP